MKKNPTSKAWASADARWLGLVKLANGALTKSFNRYERIAAQEITKLANHVEPRKVVMTVAAMYVMQDLDPHRFRSDVAFSCQLVRRVRGLTPANAQTWRSAGVAKVAYSELPPRAAAALAAWLAEALGVVGVHLAKLELADRKKEEEERRHFYEALADLS